MTFRTKTGKIASASENEACLSGLYDEYYDRIARYAFVRIGNTADAEDIASEVFIKALDSIDRYQDRGLPMQAWLFKIAHNLVVDYLRNKSKKSTLPLDTIKIAGETDPAEKAEINLEMERVHTAMQSLTEEQREVVRLRFFGGLSSREVGELLNKNDGAVREMQRAAMEKLRKLMNA